MLLYTTVVWNFSLILFLNFVVIWCNVFSIKAKNINTAGSFQRLKALCSLFRNGKPTQKLVYLPESVNINKDLGLNISYKFCLLYNKLALFDIKAFIMFLNIGSNLSFGFEFNDIHRVVFKQLYNYTLLCLTQLLLIIDINRNICDKGQKKFYLTEKRVII
jgi:hypothetical protein